LLKNANGLLKQNTQKHGGIYMILIKLQKEFDIKRMNNLFKVDKARYKQQANIGFPFTKENL